MENETDHPCVACCATSTPRGMFPTLGTSGGSRLAEVCATAAIVCSRVLVLRRMFEIRLISARAESEVARGIF